MRSIYFKLIFILLAIFFPMVLVPYAVKAVDIANPPVPLMSGVPIGTANAKLLAAGWQAVVTHRKFADGVEESSVGEAGTLKADGITSVEDCSGTGLSFCTFNYRRKKDCLRITSQGEVSPIVVQWDLFRCIAIRHPERDPMHQPVYVFRNIIDPILACPWDRLDQTPWCTSPTNGLAAVIHDGEDAGASRSVTLLLPIDHPAIASLLARALLPSWNKAQEWMERALAVGPSLPPEQLIRVSDVFVQVSQQYFANSPTLFAVVTISRSTDVPPNAWLKNSTIAPDGKRISRSPVPVPSLK